MCGHVVIGCIGLTQREYWKRHDGMRLRVYWELNCLMYGARCTDVWYKEVPDANEVRVSDERNVFIPAEFKYHLLACCFVHRR